MTVALAALPALNRWSGRPPDPGATTALLFPGAGGQTACDLSLVWATAPDLAERAVVEVGADPFLRAEACDNAPPGGMIRASGLAERRARPLRAWSGPSSGAPRCSPCTRRARATSSTSVRATGWGTWSAARSPRRRSCRLSL